MNHLANLLFSLSARSNSVKELYARKTPTCRKLRMEALERRDLLSVDVGNGAVITEFSPVESNGESSSTNAIVCVAPQNQSETPDVSIDVSSVLESSEPPTYDEYMPTLEGLEIEQTGVGSFDDIPSAVPDLFVVDSVSYASLTEIHARHVLFGSSQTNEIFDDSSLVVPISDEPQGFVMMGMQSGGSGGDDPLTGDSSETTNLSSSIADMPYVNPLSEGRGVESGGGSIQLANVDSLRVTVPELPLGYAAYVTFSGTANLDKDYIVALPNGSSSFTTLHSGFEYSGGVDDVLLDPSK